jgi:hypothetical protein
MTNEEWRMRVLYLFSDKMRQSVAMPPFGPPQADQSPFVIARLDHQIASLKEISSFFSHGSKS